MEVVDPVGSVIDESRHALLYRELLLRVAKGCSLVVVFHAFHKYGGDDDPYGSRSFAALSGSVEVMLWSALVVFTGRSILRNDVVLSSM